MRAIETGVLCFSRVVPLSLMDIWNCPAVTVWAYTYTHILIVQTHRTTNYTHRSLKIFRRRRHDHRMLTPLRQCTPPAGGSDSCVFYAKIGPETRIANVSKKNTLGVKEMLKCSLLLYSIQKPIYNPVLRVVHWVLTLSRMSSEKSGSALQNCWLKVVMVEGMRMRCEIQQQQQ